MDAVRDHHRLGGGFRAKPTPATITK